MPAGAVVIDEWVLRPNPWKPEMNGYLGWGA